MSNLTFDDPCVVFALRREARPFLRLFPPQQRFPQAPCWARFCGPAWLTVLVLQTGVGAEAAQRAAQWILGRPILGNVPYQPKVLLSVGFCGALREGYRVGDVILAREVVDEEGNNWPVTWPGELPSGEWHPPLHPERVLTSTHMIATVQEKQTLGSRFGAGVVDMESAWIARACQHNGIPFGCVRVVSDDGQTSLSRTGHLPAGSRGGSPAVAGGRSSIPAAAGGDVPPGRARPSSGQATRQGPGGNADVDLALE